MQPGYLTWIKMLLAVPALCSNTSTPEETVWRRPLWRRAPSWPRCATPCPSTPRAPTLSSRPLSPRSTPKVSGTARPPSPGRFSRLRTTKTLPRPRSAWRDGHQNHRQWENAAWQGWVARSPQPGSERFRGSAENRQAFLAKIHFRGSSEVFCIAECDTDVW